ncbi:MAG: hypothetical protein ACWA44_05575 [Thiotrichales bacterium]
MTLEPEIGMRIKFLTRVVTKERKHLLATDQRLFEKTFTLEMAQSLENNIELAERVEAFVARFGRLQDTLGDKLLPVLLRALGEQTGAVIDNLDRAERLGFIPSVEDWLTIRKLRNQMVHDYIEDLAVLTDALTTGHEYVPQLTESAAIMIAEIERRDWS